MISEDKTTGFLKIQLISIVWNILLIFAAYFICGLLFYFENSGSYTNALNLSLMFQGWWRFTLSATLYTNILLAVIYLIPLHYKYCKFADVLGRILFVTVNSIAIIVNLMDAVYFKYTGRRTDASVFKEFGNEDNIGGIIGHELLMHWYFVIAGILLFYALYKLYLSPLKSKYKPSSLPIYYALQTIVLGALGFGIVCGMRGGIGRQVRPIAVGNANQYVNKPIETALVLNTPFCLIRTVGKNAYKNPQYFSDSEAEQIFCPIRQKNDADTTALKKMNVVVLIVESFAKEHIGALNKELEDGRYEGYTPFVDSLVNESLTFKYSYANGRKSIDGMPSILSSIPMFVEPFFVTPAALNTVSGLAGELKSIGYKTAFFHGASNGSMGFEAFAKATGFSEYYGRTEFDNDPNYKGEKEFDGNWGIWDEPFMQFYCDEMSRFKQPFMTAIFTVSSHHPFNIPEKYKKTFPEGKLEIHKCIRYTDYALRRFFESASKQKWFNNTIFVLTADHTNQKCHPVYETDLNLYSVPIIFYAPGLKLKGYDTEKIAQQIDIMPTVLQLLGYDKPYLAFGKDLINTPAEETSAVNYNNGIYQYIKNDYMMQFDGTRVTGMYKFKTDLFLKQNLVGKVPEQAQMEKELKAIIQQYMITIGEDRLTYKTYSKARK